ncbi:hypothetical protein P171DRAFT_426564 [Karstenula rhodostoma CBS 690.94]|uniref:Uncharacterized protein n=1 Tax=Karstenula rhodostoma CBS 690.94 TaxID=1392251 RepID=A0A9P4PVK2_9PLEO|nr:hypothetical protein P171DRAFT_426564 [Karstenula rhodostoma CBS 690.94]
MYHPRRPVQPPHPHPIPQHRRQQLSHLPPEPYETQNRTKRKTILSPWFSCYREPQRRVR